MRDVSTSAANEEVEQADAQHCKKRGTYHHYDDEIWAKTAKYLCIYESLEFIFAKETLNILAAKINISRFTVTEPPNLSKNNTINFCDQGALCILQALEGV